MANKLSVVFQQQSVSTWSTCRKWNAGIWLEHIWNCPNMPHFCHSVMFSPTKYPETLSQFSVTKNNLLIQCGKLIRCVTTWCRTLRAVKMGYQADAVMACLKVTACACLQSLKSTHATICFGLQRLPRWRAFGRPFTFWAKSQQENCLSLTYGHFNQHEVKPNPETALRGSRPCSRGICA